MRGLNQEEGWGCWDCSGAGQVSIFCCSVWCIIADFIFFLARDLGEKKNNALPRFRGRRSRSRLSVW